jgi:ubiquinone/menaquinone biosynthesis C-methylase UbiE
MGFKTFFSEQARNPYGLFGRYIMPIIFDQGNATLNALMGELLDLEEGNHVLEIGFGTGRFINTMAKYIRNGCIEGIDLSKTMVAIAKRKNQKFIEQGKVIIHQGDFKIADYRDNSFDKICSANTIYFWPDPDGYAKKIYQILKPGGKAVLAFEDIKQLERKSLSNRIFKFYRPDEIEGLLMRNAFSGGIDIYSKRIKSLQFHCAVAVK